MTTRLLGKRLLKFRVSTYGRSLTVPILGFGSQIRTSLAPPPEPPSPPRHRARPAQAPRAPRSAPASSSSSGQYAKAAHSAKAAAEPTKPAKPYTSRGMADAVVSSMTPEGWCAAARGARAREREAAGRTEQMGAARREAPTRARGGGARGARALAPTQALDPSHTPSHRRAAKRPRGDAPGARSTHSDIDDYTK